MEPNRQHTMALSTLRVAAGVLLGGWCSAGVIGLASWSLTDRLTGFPLAYFALPLIAVLAITYVIDGRSERSLADSLVTGWLGFLLGSLPVLAVMPGNPAVWLASLLVLSLTALASAGLAASVRATVRARSAATA